MDLNGKCPCCDTNNRQINKKLSKIVFGKEYAIEKCITCGCGFTMPMPSSGDELYNENERYEKLFEKNRNKYKQYAEELIELLGDFPKSGTLLDIGCGSGALLEVAESKGLVAQGIEVNKLAIEQALKYGLDVKNISLDDIRKTGIKYDIIVLSAVLEHVKDPMTLLLQAKKILKNDGILLISQADYSGIFPQYFPNLWYGWQPNEHYYHFTENSMKSLLKKLDFNTFEIQKNNLDHSFVITRNVKYFFGKNIAAIIQVIINLIGGNDSFNIKASR